MGPADPARTPGVEDPHPPGHDSSQCDHGPYKPITSYFAREPPSNPALHPFFTAFSPGVGRSWFVEGQKVWETQGSGWTDVDKNSALGDMIWPRPTLAWHESERTEALPTATPALNMQDAWMGGTSLQLSLSIAGSDAEDAFFRCLWIPVQSLAISPGIPYIVTLVYKDDLTEHNVEGDIGLLLKPLGEEQGEVEITPIGSQCGDLQSGWKRLSVQVVLPSSAFTDLVYAVGLVLGLAPEDPTLPLQPSISLGSLSVYPLPQPSTVEPAPKIIWADFAASPPPGAIGSAARFSGVLTWETGVYLPPITSLTLTGPEDPNPAWQSASRSPGFLYFNVYALAHSVSQGTALRPEDASFIGTTGLDGRANRFFVDPACLTGLVDDEQIVRFYVQGVTERGTVTPWQDSVFVDVSS